MPVSLIACVFPSKSQRLVIGHNGDLIAHLTADQKRFRELTYGQTIVMGRKTWESLPPARRPLPGRTHIVLTRNVMDLDLESGLNTRVQYMLFDDFLRYMRDDIHYWVIGGAEIYGLFLRLDSSSPAYPQNLYLTEVTFVGGSGSVEGDTYFPEFGSDYALVDVSDSIVQAPYKYRYLQ